jgi:hypothetical protein
MLCFDIILLTSEYKKVIAYFKHHLMLNTSHSKITEQMMLLLYDHTTADKTANNSKIASQIN